MFLHPLQWGYEQGCSYAVQDMEELAEQVLGKLQNMSDEEFAGVVLEPAEEIS